MKNTKKNIHNLIQDKVEILKNLMMMVLIGKIFIEIIWLIIDLIVKVGY